MGNVGRITMKLSQFFIVTVCASMLVACSGVAISDKNGATHHLIIGVGIVSTINQDEVESVQVTKSNILGFHISNQPGVKVGAGYLSSSTLVIPSDSNMIIEVEDKPLGIITIKSTSQK